MAAKGRGLFWKIFLLETVRARASKFGMQLIYWPYTKIV